MFFCGFLQRFCGLENPHVGICFTNPHMGLPCSHANPHENTHKNTIEFCVTFPVYSLDVASCCSMLEHSGVWHSLPKSPVQLPWQPRASYLESTTRCPYYLHTSISTCGTQNCSTQTQLYEFQCMSGLHTSPETVSCYLLRACMYPVVEIFANMHLYLL